MNNMNNKVNSTIMFLAISTILMNLLLLVVNYTNSIGDPYMYIFIRESIIWNVLEVVSYGLWAYWAVQARNNVVVILGSILFIISQLSFQIISYRMGEPITLIGIIFIFAVLCAGISFLVASFKNNKKKFMLFSFIMLAILEIYSLFETVCSMFLYTNASLVINCIAHIFTSILYIALVIYVIIDGKPTEKITLHKNEYLQKKTKNKLSIENQLDQLKEYYESGMITTEEYKNRRIEILKKFGK